MANQALIEAFDQEMFRIYERARSEAHYNATRFLHMLYEHRGLKTAKQPGFCFILQMFQRAILPCGSGAGWTLPLRQSFMTPQSGMRCLP